MYAILKAARSNWGEASVAEKCWLTCLTELTGAPPPSISMVLLLQIEYHCHAVCVEGAHIEPDHDALLGFGCL